MIIDFYDKYPDENVKIVREAVDSSDDDEDADDQEINANTYNNERAAGDQAG